MPANEIEIDVLPDGQRVGLKAFKKTNPRRRPSVSHARDSMYRKRYDKGSMDEWRNPDPFPTPAPNDVHVWLADLSRRRDAARSLRDMLSADESERADRFQLDESRDRYIVARATLRLILGQYLRQNPASLKFSYGPKGKPMLETGGEFATIHLLSPPRGERIEVRGDATRESCHPHPDPLPPKAGEGAREQSRDFFYFNVAHCGALALYGFTRAGPIGVDLEYVDRSTADVDDIARRFFSAAEFAALESLPTEHRRLGFFNGWTRKEAFVKAVGDGLSMPLDRFEVTLAPDVPARLVRFEDDPDAAGRWFMASIEPAEQCVGAVAVRGRVNGLSLWRAPEF